MTKNLLLAHCRRFEVRASNIGLEADFMVVAATFLLATLSPSIIILGMWFLLRRSGRWLRLLGTSFSVFASPVIGFVLVLMAVELSNPGSRNPGAGVAALPMVLVYFLAMLAAIIIELVRVAKAARSKATP